MHKSDLGDFIFWTSKEKFCTWMYLCCDRMDAKKKCLAVQGETKTKKLLDEMEQWNRH
jgi:hypothetical protein